MCGAPEATEAAPKHTFETSPFRGDTESKSLDRVFGMGQTYSCK